MQQQLDLQQLNQQLEQQFNQQIDQHVNQQQHPEKTKQNKRRFLPNDDDDKIKPISKKSRKKQIKEEAIAETLAEEEATSNDSYQELNTENIHFSNRLFLENVFEKIKTDCETNMIFKHNEFNTRRLGGQFEEMFDAALVDTLLAHCGQGTIAKQPATRIAIENACLNTDIHTSFIYVAYNPNHFDQHVECTFKGIKQYLKQLILGFLIYAFPICISPHELASRHNVLPNEVVDIKYLCSADRVGSKLMLHFMNNMKNRGKRLFILEEASLDGSHKLINFYKSFGFSHVVDGSGDIASWKTIRSSEERFYMICRFSENDDTIIRQLRTDN